MYIHYYWQHSTNEESATVAIDLNVNANPAYETATSLQSNVAYEGIKAPISGQAKNVEPVYDDIYPPQRL